MFREEQLDLVLVPLALAAVGGYHLWLLWAILRHPTRTVIGLNAIARKRWVAAMMANTEKNGVLAVQTLRNNIMASTVLATTAITLVSVISVFIGVTSPASSSNSKAPRALVYVREQGRGGVRGQVPGRVALLHARLRLQRAGHPAVRARQLPPGRPAARRRRRGARGVRVLRGADGEPRQLRLVARPARLLRLPRALPLDVRTHADAGLQRAHVRPALLPRHHQQRRPRPPARPPSKDRRRRPKG